MADNSIKGFKVGNEVKKYDYNELDNLPENDPDDLAEEVNDLKSDLSAVTSMVGNIADDTFSSVKLEEVGWDTDRALTEGGKSVSSGSVIASYEVTSGTILKVNLKNRTGGNILFFFQDTKDVPWSNNTHIIGSIHKGASFNGYIKVPSGATHLVVNSNTDGYYTYNSVESITEYKSLFVYHGQMSDGSYNRAKVGVYAVNSATVTGLPPNMRTQYGWLICFVPNNLYILIESNTSKTTWILESDEWKEYPTISNYGQSRLSNKKIVYNGDSIAESRTSGYSSNGGGYPLLIANITGGSYENKAVSGGTLAVSSASHHVCETISTMSSDADIVCLEGGINDYWLNVPLGDYSETDFTGTVDNTTICGALESIFRQSINKWVGKPIVFVIVHKITTTAWTQNTAGYTFAQAREKMIGICEKYSIPYIDMWSQGGLNAYMSALDNAFLNGGSNTHPDGCHPDVNGYRKYYVPRLISMFESLLPYD